MRSKGNKKADRSAASGLAGHLAPAANFFQALLHVLQPIATLERLLRIEAAAIITDDKYEGGSPRLNSHGYLRRAGIFNGIVQRFLGCAIKVVTNVGGQT